MQRPIVLVGSLNMDLVVPVTRQPTPGETVLGGDYATYPGGKGANQAVAAARAGGQVKMIGLVGNDAFGAQLRANLAANQVDASGVGVWEGPTGIALITVDAQGQNMIVVSPGANGHLTPDRIPSGLLNETALVVMQLEVPLATVEYVVAACVAAKTPVLLNPAPATPLSDAVLQGVSYLVVNETEATILTGVLDSRAAAERLLARGVQTVIVTLGDRGLLWCNRLGEGRLPAHAVEVVDTTAAGDAFCGALAARLAEKSSFLDALRFANAAGALTVTRRGAQPSLPTRAEIEALLARG